MTIEEINRLKAIGLQFAVTSSQDKVSSSLEGKTIVVSGNFSISRDEMKALIAAHGGKCASSVSGSTSFLLAGTKPGPEKIRRCASLGIPVIDEQAFRSMIPAAQSVPQEEQLSLF